MKQGCSHEGHEVWLRTSTRDHMRRLYAILQDGMMTRTGQPARLLSSVAAENLYQIGVYSDDGEDLRLVIRKMEKARLVKIREIDCGNM